jgi:hypothetical protein
MIPIIYYAHSMKIYNTQREQDELMAIGRTFPEAIIYNPNRPYIQSHKEPMKACLHIVRDVSMLVFSLENKRITSGVMLEVRLAFKHEIPVYLLRHGEIDEFSGVFRKITRNKKSYWTV